MAREVCLLIICIGMMFQCISCDKLFVLDRLKHLKSKTSPEDQTLAVQKLIARLFASRSNEFNLLVKPGNGELDTFQYVSDADGKINVQASTGVALAAGVYHFLKYHCNIHVSWSGDQLNLPNPLPRVTQLVKINFQDRFRYYQNVCTSSYSFAFWDWARWEKEIDWMALNGINFPLAFTGQEGIWQMVYKELGLTQKELDEHFAGPAFLAWQRMGNVDAWGGPLPVGWYKNRLALQKQILNRMRSFGMLPVLPGFAGHIPKALVTRLYPHANYTNVSTWYGFILNYSTVLLNPVDPLFRTVGQKFIEKQIEVYNGTDHVYNGDVFNEMLPPEFSESYMHSASKNIFQAMQAGDADATWLLQGWTFLQSFWNETLVKAWLSAVPYGKLIILDLASELYPIWPRNNGYYGYPFIWNMIENFGGNTRIFGTMEHVVKNLLLARSKNPHMIGIGTTPEGINQNIINFEVLYEMTWRVSEFDMVEFAKQYFQRRHGVANADVQDAIVLMMKAVLNSTSAVQNGGGAQGRLTVTQPHLVDTLKTNLWYNPADLFQAWTHLVNGAQGMKMSDTLRHDLIRVGAQAIEDIGSVIFTGMIASFKNKSIDDFTHHSTLLLSALEDMDSLYATNPYTLLGTWLEGAKSISGNDKERRNNEYNARNQITLWGPSGQISDYANKNWAGLIKSYYHTRWQRFTDALLDSLKTGKKYDGGAFQYQLLVWAEKWCWDVTPFPTKPQGDVLKISQILNKKYTALLNGMYKHDAKREWRRMTEETLRKKPESLPFLQRFKVNKA